MKLTEWFHGDVKPVRPGVYLRDYLMGECWCFWNEHEWLMGFSAEEEDSYRLASEAFAPSLRQSLPWRGLAEKP